MKTRQNKLTAILTALLFSVGLIWFAPVNAEAQAIILKPGEIIYGRFVTNPNSGQNCSTASVWSVGQDGSNDRLLFSNAVHPRISPDGRFIMFKRFSPSALCIPFSAGAEIWIRELATARETRIAEFTQPFGTFFTMETNRADNQIMFDTQGVVCRVNLDGTNRFCSTLGLTQANYTHPSVRGGDFLSVIASEQLTAELGGLYTFNYNLTNPQKIPNTSRHDESPSWSNDGQTLAYGFVPPPNNNPQFYADLYKINSDGSNKTRLTFLNGQPNGSPNGFRHSLVWTTNSVGDEFIFNAVNVNNVARIYKISADGSGNMSRVQITAGNAPDWVGGIVPVIGEQQVVGFGGGLTSGGSYSLVDTIGQAFAGQTSTGGSFNLQSGFWTTPVQNKKALFDFDGDGKTDISIFRPSVGEWYFQRSSNSVVNGAQFGNSTDKPIPADYTGDGKTDIAFFRPSSGQWFILRSEDSSFFAFPFGISTDIPSPGDFDGDGKTDAAVFRPSNGVWYIQKSTGGVIIQPFGVNGDRTVVADYDGDGKSDIAIYRPSVGEWYYLRSTDSQVRGAQFGSSTDKTVQGDYTGDGKADFAFFRPSTGSWFVLRSEDSSFFASPFGVSTDIPTIGDYDGDGKFDTAVFRPSNGVWYINKSNGSGVTIQQFGVGTDLPVPSYYLP